jgi:lysophospholipase L1-like esterase
MKAILCYGDSNTWGYDPVTKGRFPRDMRWTGVLRQSLGDDYLVIEEGLNGRTTVWDDPIEGYKNGAAYLVPCLTTHRPLDLVIIMLGTNDLKRSSSQIRTHIPVIG